MHRDEETERKFLVLWLSLPMATVTTAELSSSQQAGSRRQEAGGRRHSGSPPWVQHPNTLGLLHGFPLPPVGIPTSSGASATRTGASLSTGIELMSSPLPHPPHPPTQTTIHFNHKKIVAQFVCGTFPGGTCRRHTGLRVWHLLSCSHAA